jgi:ABC-type transport system involved in cytochrome c biogenesis permease subunit
MVGLFAAAWASGVLGLGLFFLIFGEKWLRRAWNDRNPWSEFLEPPWASRDKFFSATSSA